LSISFAAIYQAVVLKIQLSIHVCRPRYIRYNSSIEKFDALVLTTYVSISSTTLPWQFASKHPCSSGPRCLLYCTLYISSHFIRADESRTTSTTRQIHVCQACGLSRRKICNFQDERTSKTSELPRRLSLGLERRVPEQTETESLLGFTEAAVRAHKGSHATDYIAQRTMPPDLVNRLG
jgi:hypothetical protein